MIRRHAAALLLCGASLLAACGNTANGTAQDAAIVLDRREPNDLSSDIVDIPDAGAVTDVARDVPDSSDASVDVRSPWGDATLVDVGGGILIPVDPNAVPAPGSECIGDGGARDGDPSIAPPRPVRPYSVSRVTSQRPSFQWILPEGTTGARLEVCADRCCTRVLQTVDAEGSTVRLTTLLPAGVVYWRLFGRRGAAVGSRASYTWEFGVRRRDAPNDTSWGTLRDFTGDGYDDLVIFRPIQPLEDPTRILLFEGSPTALRAPRDTGIVSNRGDTWVAIGDLNGDGLADIAWESEEGDHYYPNRYLIAAGSRSALRESVGATTAGMPSCARVGAAAITDWNGDGYSDLVATLTFGCDFARPPELILLSVYRGSVSGIALVPQWVARLDDRFPHRNTYLNGNLGDVDMDGYGDISAYNAHGGIGTSSIPPEQFILYGSPFGGVRSERLPRPDSADVGSWAYARFGAVGDYNGDHALDFVVRATYDNRLNVYLNASDLSRPPVTLSDPLRGGEFGYHFDTGDVDGDGLADVLAASQLATPDPLEPLNNRGRAYVFLGTVSGINATPLWTERRPADAVRAYKDVFGARLSSPGDLNGDGIDDMTMADSLDFRLCVRLGRLGFSSGSPDVCFDNFLGSSSRSF